MCDYELAQITGHDTGEIAGARGDRLPEVEGEFTGQESATIADPVWGQLGGEQT